MKRVFAPLILVLCLVALAGCRTEHQWRQKTTLTVETPAGPRSGSSVVEVTALFGKLPLTGNEVEYSFHGEATVVEIMPGRYLFALLGSLPKAEWLLADRGYDADWFREALRDKGIKPCIPGRKSRGKPVKHDKRRYKRRNRIEVMFGRLKDWRRVATRYDRCPKVFLSAIALAATVMFWL